MFAHFPQNFAIYTTLATGLMLTRPDSFVPPVDIVVENGEYAIFMDVPGLSAKGIFLFYFSLV